MHMTMHMAKQSVRHAVCGAGVRVPVGRRPVPGCRPLRNRPLTIPALCLALASELSGSSLRTMTEVSIGEISAAATAAGVGAPRIEWSPHIDLESIGANEKALHEARLSAVVELIENLTGRQVKLVPPAAYFVSRPAPPVDAPVDVTVRADMEAVSGAGPGPLEVGIQSILRTGTASRMVLNVSPAGGLDLSTAVDLDL
jgi:hypothetical protein